MAGLLFSGQYRTFRASRRVQNPKFCRSVLIRGISNAIKDPLIQSVKVLLDYDECKGYSIENDRVVFADLVSIRQFRLDIVITYSDFERVVRF